MLRIVALGVLAFGYFAISNHYDLAAWLSEPFPSLQPYAGLVVIGIYTLLVAAVVAGSNKVTSKVDLTALNTADWNHIARRVGSLGLGDLAALKTEIDAVKNVLVSAGQVAMIKVDLGNLRAQVAALKQLNIGPAAEQVKELADAIQAVNDLDVSEIDPAKFQRLELTAKSAIRLTDSLKDDDDDDIDLDWLKERIEAVVDVLEVVKKVQANPVANLTAVRS